MNYPHKQRCFVVEAPGIEPGNGYPQAVALSIGRQCGMSLLVARFLAGRVPYNPAAIRFDPPSRGPLDGPESK